MRPLAAVKNCEAVSMKFYVKIMAILTTQW